MKIVFYGGRQTGAIVLLECARRHKVVAVAAQDNFVATVAKKLDIPVMSPSLLKPDFAIKMKGIDLFVCAHGLQIIPVAIFENCKLGGVNFHPCLYKYKGLHPIERMLADGEKRASVGAHRMSSKVDCGDVILEEFVDLQGDETTCEKVYEALYPTYGFVSKKVLDFYEEAEGEMQMSMDYKKMRK